MVSFLHSLYCCYSISAYSFHDYLSLCGQLAGEIGLQLSLKRFPSLGPPVNGNESNAIKSQFCPNWNLTGIIYHRSVILKSFSVVSNSATGDANGVFEVPLPSSHLLNSWHPVRKSKFGTCAVTGYCSYKCLHVKRNYFKVANWQKHHARNQSDCRTEGFYPLTSVEKNRFTYFLSNWAAPPALCTSFVTIIFLLLDSFARWKATFVAILE